ncbi:MAG TPA: hypothetical protein VND21_06365 [Planctomycetota bacterium]|nr:hypothetical protein [Planctomycetota bacterium]
MGRASLLALLLLTGCAGVTVSGADGSRDAVRVHPPRVFLAASRLAAPGLDGATHEARLLLLPDPDRPRWIRVVPGLGAASVDVRLENGMLATLEAATDGKGPETGRAAGESARRALERLAANAVDRTRASPLTGAAPVEILFEVLPRDDGDVDLVPVPPEEVRRLLGTARSVPPVERRRLPR